MSTSSKSPRKVALTAMAVARKALPLYAHRFAPKKFTQPQLFACMVLRRFFKTDYRGLAAYLADMPDLCRAMELPGVPHFTTIQKAEQRLLTLPRVRKLLDGSARLGLGRRRIIRRAAADSTGLEATSASRYFVRRKARGQKEAKNPLYQTTTYRRFPKLGLIADVDSHLILGLRTGRGPRPDVDELAGLILSITPEVCVRHLLADGGYDSEFNHTYARQEHGILTTIPPKLGRPTTKPAGGRYRRLMQTTLANRNYGQRWQAETVMSMLKRNQGAAVRGLDHRAQSRQARLAVLTHNIVIPLS